MRLIFSWKAGQAVSGHSKCLLVDVREQSSGLLPGDLAKYTKLCKWLLNAKYPGVKSSLPVHYRVGKAGVRYWIKTSRGFIVSVLGTSVFK